jgi:predicted nucleic acid-binding protein
VNAAGVLLDTGPLVALLSKDDGNHARARQLFARCVPPFRTCEAVLAEACHLLRKVHPGGPAEVVALRTRGLYHVAMSIDEEASHVEAVLRKYASRPVSLADACLIRSAEIHQERRILTFDRDFDVYKWARNRAFEILN